jgi:hypothetical protein
MYLEAAETFEIGGPDLAGKQECVNVLAATDVPVNGRTWERLTGSGCDVGDVKISPSLQQADVRAQVPGYECDFDGTCFPTTISVAVDWQATGDIARVNGGVTHGSDYSPDARCLWHDLPFAEVSATATGEVYGAAPLGKLVSGELDTGGVIEHGSVSSCYD